MIRITALLLGGALPMALYAHDMWFEMNDFNLKNGESMECSFPSDHAFPSTNNEFVPADRVAKSYIISPTGGYIPIILAEKQKYRSSQKLVQPGSYLAVTGKKWTYWVKTTDGFIEGKNKSQVKNPLQGIYSAKFSKAIITVDKPGGSAFSRIVGHDLEIIPLKDPSILAKGDILPVKVLLNGKPAAMELKATYDGYSSRNNVFAERITTNKQGMGEIKIGKKGKWLIQAGYTEKAADTRLYDEKMYAATLTFQIK